MLIRWDIQSRPNIKSGFSLFLLLAFVFCDIGIVDVFCHVFCARIFQIVSVTLEFGRDTSFHLMDAYQPSCVFLSLIRGAPD